MNKFIWPPSLLQHGEFAAAVKTLFLELDTAAMCGRSNWLRFLSMIAAWSSVCVYFTYNV